MMTDVNYYNSMIGKRVSVGEDFGALMAPETGKESKMVGSEKDR